MCDTVYEWCHLVKATEVTASMAESNSSLPTGGWLSHLWAVHRDHFQAQRSVTSMRKLYLFTFTYCELRKAMHIVWYGLVKVI